MKRPARKVDPGKLKRLKGIGEYLSGCGTYRISHWDTQAYGQSNRASWAICYAKDDEFICELLTLCDARKWLRNEKVFILS